MVDSSIWKASHKCQIIRHFDSRISCYFLFYLEINISVALTPKYQKCYNIIPDSWFLIKILFAGSLDIWWPDIQRCNGLVFLCSYCTCSPGYLIPAEQGILNPGPGYFIPWILVWEKKITGVVKKGDLLCICKGTFHDFLKDRVFCPTQKCYMSIFLTENVNRS